MAELILEDLELNSTCTVVTKRGVNLTGRILEAHRDYVRMSIKAGDGGVAYHTVTRGEIDRILTFS